MSPPLPPNLYPPSSVGESQQSFAHGVPHEAWTVKGEQVPHLQMLAAPNSAFGNSLLTRLLSPALEVLVELSLSHQGIPRPGPLLGCPRPFHEKPQGVMPLVPTPLRQPSRGLVCFHSLNMSVVTCFDPENVAEVLELRAEKAVYSSCLLLLEPCNTGSGCPGRGTTEMTVCRMREHEARRHPARL